jgi:hypothetical protein
VAPLPGESLPYLVDPLALYALLSNGRGAHEFSVELARFDRGEENLIGRIGPVRIDLGQDPLAVLGLPIPVRNLVFEETGQYSFYLICDAQQIAEEKILVR